MITILTRNPDIFTSEYLKHLLNKILQRTRGPSAVVSSLSQGLEELSIPFKLNPSKKHITGTVHVINGVGALKWCIENKDRYKIKKIIAGPNIVVLPDEAGGIMKSNKIDLILFPAKWCKDWWVSMDPNFEEKIKVWASGVSYPNQPTKMRSNKKRKVIIYQKNAPYDLFCLIKKEAEKYFEIVEVLTYGSFRQKRYFDSLSNSQALIYLSKSESQGIAMQEAWIRNVPTIVWSCGKFFYHNKSWFDPMIGSPYLDEKECGILFESKDDFTEKLLVFLDNLSSYRPRAYANRLFSNVSSAKDYLKKINYE